MNKVEGVVPCSNHGCVFGHPGGMGTNGQCHCLDIRPPDARIRATRNVLALRTALTAERERADTLMRRLVAIEDEHLAYADDVGDVLGQGEDEPLLTCARRVMAEVERLRAAGANHAVNEERTLEEVLRAMAGAMRSDE